MARLSQVATLDEIFQIAHRGGEAIGESGHVDHARTIGRVGHFLHFAGVQPQWLFAHDVLAATGGGDRNLLVREIRGGDQHAVNVIGGADLAIVGRDPLDTPFRAAVVEQLGIGVAGGDQRGARIEPDARHVVIIADGAAPMMARRTG